MRPIDAVLSDLGRGIDRRPPLRRSLRQRRVSLGMTQVTFALEAGLSSQTVIAAEKGRKVSPRTVAKIEAALAKLERT